jgi:hypothetical protein
MLHPAHPSEIVDYFVRIDSGVAGETMLNGQNVDTPWPAFLLTFVAVVTVRRCLGEPKDAHPADCIENDLIALFDASGLITSIADVG